MPQTPQTSGTGKGERLKAPSHIMSLLIFAKTPEEEGTGGVEGEAVFLLVTSPRHLVLQFPALFKF